jgi:uncharacterized protein (TIGR03083 family)
MSTRTETTATLRATWAALDAVAASLTPEQWTAQSLCPDWTAHGVLVHATTIEQVLVGWPPGGDAPFASIGPTNAELTALAPDALLARFRRVVGERTAELEAMTDEDFATPGVTPVGPGTYGRFMAIRVFDNWVHERDIRVPLGLPGDDAGPAAEMSLDEVQLSLGYIVGKRIGLEDGKGIAFDITGPVSRRMLVKVDGRAAVTEELPNPDVTLTTDSLTFMLLACGRIDPEEPIADGRVKWTGDDEIGGRAARSLRFTM